MYPQTVKHFIELADEGFYDNTVIHDYKTNDWYGGGYSYDQTYATAYNTTGGLREYFMETTSLESKYYNELFLGGKLSPSVYASYEADGDDFVGTDALPTLIGEFTKNDHTVLKGAINSQFGALKMYYTSGKTYSGSSSSQKVWIETTKDDSAFERDYKYNSATSLFSIQVGAASSLSNSEYCTFAILKGDGDEDKLNELKDAISDYISENYSGSTASFTKSVEVVVDNFEQVADKGTEVDYTATAVPIIIKTVKITKY